MDDSSWKNADLACVAALILVVAAAFGQSVNHELVNFDDNVYLTANASNPHLADGLTGPNIRWAFDPHYYTGNYHPATWLSLLLDISLAGSISSPMFHATNVILHALNACLVYWLLRRWIAVDAAIWPALAGAILWAIHPLRAESVAWATERKDVLSALFGLLAIHAYCHFARRGRWPFYGWMIAAWMASLLSKPMLVTLPFLFLLLDIWPLRRPMGFRLIGEKLPMIGITIGMSWLAYTAQVAADSAAELRALGMSPRIENMLVGYMRYIGKIFWPEPLLAPYQYRMSWPPIAVIGSALGLAAGSIGAAMNWRRHPWIATGWFWFMGLLVPVIGILQVGQQSIADRYTYLPMIGLVMVLVQAVGGRKRVWIVVIAAMTPVLMWRTWNQVALWKDSETLFRHTLRYEPHNPFALVNLGAALAESGRRNEAKAQFLLATMVAPTLHEPAYSLANQLAAEGDDREALEFYRKALDLAPGDLMTIINYANSLARTGDPKAARRLLEPVIDRAADFPEAFSNFANLLAADGEYDRALSYYDRALAAQPDFPSFHVNKSMTLVQMKRYDQAIAQFARSRKPPLDAVHAAIDLAQMLHSAHRTALADPVLRRQLEATPDEPSLMNNLGVLCYAAGKPEEAMRWWKESLNLKEDFADAHANLSIGYQAAGQDDPALKHLRRAVELDPKNAAYQQRLERMAKPPM